MNTNLPPFTPGKPQTNRDRMSEHVVNPGCASCHSLIDPIGFGFEKFDAVGGRRDKFTLMNQQGRRADRDKPVKAWELEIDSSGFVAGVANSKFASPAQLGAVLGQSAQCQECVAKQYFRYIAGRAETAADRPVIKKMADDFRRSQFRFKELMMSLLLSRENSGETLHAVRNH